MSDPTTEGSPPVEIDIERIIEMIPHRYPFLMIDRIIDVVPDERAVALKNVSVNEPHFQGHFPGRRVMPGVLIIESMAQTAAVLVVQTLGADSEGKLQQGSVNDERFIVGNRVKVPWDFVLTRSNRFVYGPFVGSGRGSRRTTT